jgi:hypothetical protein
VVVGVGTHLCVWWQHTSLSLLMVVREGGGLWDGCGGLFPTYTINIIYFLNYLNQLCPVSSAGYHVVI